MLKRNPLLRSLIVALATAAAALAADRTALPAFPGAEGFGATTPGGRGGRVLFVTNLDDSGRGSLRAAINAEGPRIIVFRVSGTIVLKSPLTVRNPYLTIAGQTAPGDGICLRDYTFGVATHDVVVRYIRSRLGDVTAQENDCLDLLNGARNCVFDHCSATWSIDECLSISGDDQDVTVQWCLIGESLNASKHHKGPHGFGSLSRANGPVSWHHNLWIHNNARNPRLGDAYHRGPTFPTFDVRNNVIYDFGALASGLTEGTLKVNYVANYIRPGPSSKARTPITYDDDKDMSFYIRDNVFDGNAVLSGDNTQFFLPNKQGVKSPRIHFVDQPFAVAPVKTVSAEQALELVLAGVGASAPKRDRVDARLINDVRNRTGHIINSQTEVGGWPELQSAPAPVDTDNDGMPDGWETAHGLNPHDGNDANADRDGDGYTNVEEYINSLVGPQA